ncbi:hypothetical protein J2847_003716 [Azospirillum agricola]|uniref:hypothetical protein n=1 Tax=Azospirillum agricola TaxID=1720247 RepID=UPI001AE6192F|nr:hypothetical protein [Azospirillum agricola]MBP2230411.1 hypothetical protein [Azospirillum agricola]
MAKALADRSCSELEDMICRLTAQAERVERTLEEAKRDRESLLRDLHTARQALASRKRTSKEPVVSSHALLRYVERFLGIDVKALERSLLSQEVKAAVRAGATRVTIDGISFVVKDNVIVTVVD